MNWFRQNRWLGSFLIALGLATIIASSLLLRAKSGWDDASAHFDENAAEMNRLQRLAPFPNAENLRKMKVHAADYAAALSKIKGDLQTRVLPATPLAPNEFQSRLRQVVGSVSEKARANKVKLPQNFRLGFDEFASALPETAAAPALGQQLAQVELVVNILLDARIDALTALKRTPIAEEHINVPIPAPSSSPRKASLPNAPASKVIERNVLEVSFASTPAAARKVLNQIASANQQFLIVRTLHVLNDKDKGPSREATDEAGGATPVPQNPTGKPAEKAALHFIVGNEHVQTSATIEMLRFKF
ncbi:MAG: Amuc_1100 family pilus-like protein [Chthoniobacterales bacterium]